jgi:low temperature requirement protein LtrA
MVIIAVKVQPLPGRGYAGPMQTRTIDRFRDWFWRPPRPHGESLQDRSVSNLELLYDLVYVAVIGQASHALAAHLTARGVIEFAIVFGMIWLAWVNGSLYVELHGRQDGRTRFFVFVQMAILVLLAVFTGGAATDDGRAFAVTYAAFLTVNAWLWLSVRRRDRPEFMAVTGAWLVLMAISIVVVLASAFLPPDTRLVVWAGYVVAWLIGIKVLGARSRMFEFGVRPTDSMVERFGLFTIIVLGEVVIGVVAGLTAAEQDPLTIATGLIALVVGFGFWWMYFDVVGRRLPRPDRRAVATWILGHFPIALAIAASGAGMVTLIEHAADPTAPPETAWLLSGAVALGLAGMILTASALEDARRLSAVYRPVEWALAAGAVAALAVGWIDPAPWLLALLLALILGALWLIALGAFLRADAWAEAEEASRGAQPAGAAARTTPDS